MYTIEPYTPAEASLWDATVETSRNGTFLLRRGYMDYHSHRFADRSLLVRDARGGIAALFAAADQSMSGGTPDEIVAHPGLTYGGLVLPHDIYGSEVVDIMECVADYWRQQGRKRMLYRSIPWIFHRQPAEDDVYALFRLGAQLHSCTLASVWLTESAPQRNQNTRRNIARGRAEGILVDRSTRWHDFHALLSATLAERHGATPVHSADELYRLAKAFPDNISLHTASAPDGEMLAGTVIFSTATTDHVQYIASTEQGRSRRALPVLFDTLMKASTARCFDFGTSNENSGRILNHGLNHQKGGFGARGVAYNTWILDL